MENLLADRASRGLAASLTRYINRVPAGREFRIDEMNSITGGGRAGISNTMAAALWALDATFELAKVGVAGVNFHTFPAADYALFSNQRGRVWIVHPEYYGLLMFDRAAPAGSLLLGVSPSRAHHGGPEVKVWATRGTDGRTRVLVINKDMIEHQLLLSGAGLPANGSASLELLQAAPGGGGALCPSGYFATGMCATGGVRLAGSTFGPEQLRGRHGDATLSGLLPRSPGGCAAPLPRNCTVAVQRSSTSVIVPAASALLLFFTR